MTNIFLIRSIFYVLAHYFIKIFNYFRKSFNKRTIAISIKTKMSNCYRKLSYEEYDGVNVKHEMWSGTTITSYWELHCIHDLRFRIDLALVLARIRLSGVIQPESPGIAAWRMLGSESRIRAEREISRSENMEVPASHPGNLKSEMQFTGIGKHSTILKILTQKIYLLSSLLDSYMH